MATNEQIRALQEQLQQLLDAQAAKEAQKQPAINEAFIPQYVYQEPPRVNVNNFELKTGLITMVRQSQYGGQAIEDPNAHLAHFLELCSTVKMNGVPDDIIRLRLFPFSLRDKAKSWYHTLQLGENIVWEDLAHAFLRKFHPPGLTLKLKMDIVQFQQYDGKKLAESWERYQEKLRKCPSHGFDEGTLIIMFYNACGERTRMHLDTAAGGSLLQKGSSEAWNIIESMAATSYQWPVERVQLKRVAAASSSDPMAAMVTQQAAMATQLAELTTKIGALNVGRHEQAVIDPLGMEDVNYVNGRNYGNFQRGQPGMYDRGQQFQQGQQQFQPGARPHPNLSYGNPNNALQPPPEFSVSSGGVINEPKKVSLEDMMQQMLTEMSIMKTTVNTRMTNLESQVGHIENNFSALSKQVQMLETQVGQMANQAAAQHTPGKFPSNTEINPKNQCNAILLRSGTQYQNHTEQRDHPEQRDDRNGKGKGVEIVEEDDLETIVCDTPPTSKASSSSAVKKPIPTPMFPRPEYKPVAPFPNSLAKPKMDQKLAKFMEMFSKLHINIPLLDALRDMPGYAKFLKDAVSNKKKLGKYETINLSEECSAVLQRKLPLKQKDPGSFTIACMMGGQNFSHALCDLGASINLMPLSIFNRLEIGDIKPTSIALQMADRSITYPKGIVEDVLVQVEQFIFPADFVVLDMPEDKNTPLILGRPFLATGRALIDVQDGDLTFRVNDEKLTLSIYDAMRKPAEPPLDECNMIDSLIAFPAAVDDPLEECITQKPPPKEVPQNEVINLADSFLANLEDEEVEKNEPPKFEAKKKTPKLKEVLTFEKCLFLEYDGGSLKTHTPKKKKVKFRIFRNKNEKGAMLVEDVRTKRSVLVERAPKSRKTFQWLECCFRPP
ncbi:uncharacterized protein LOC130999277 [Salvia miltiorrhiza]|uniref:uncharacterized protein LOC130999277 n=1 Tax=Salvia miltiorrhiza TaxID=226208 RepID=UPI0025AD87D9|nr:uncharacterized protein LOC130999277 [Salvia miltiorrhiza]XP_057780768.1 uncharacterized protein LOC130999277 [Salvia miltiorrhiza]XP_057780769.1 uncharacterized protein LOC130999277 [Salvia miltiorrhiza]